MGNNVKGSAVLQEVLKEMGADSNFEQPPTTPVSKKTVLRWMESRDMEALGATYTFISEPKYYQRIRPPLTFSQGYRFTKKYYERCFLENPEGEWTNNRYGAGWDLVNWFAFLWRDATAPRSALTELKEWMAKLYKDGDQELRRCLVNATLEHLFEQQKVRRFFDDWKADPVLSVAHAEALEWVKGGGKTPLAKPEFFSRLAKARKAGGSKGEDT